jgi:hypothetical protein
MRVGQSCAVGAAHLVGERRYLEKDAIFRPATREKAIDARGSGQIWGLPRAINVSRRAIVLQKRASKQL